MRPTYRRRHGFSYAAALSPDIPLVPTFQPAVETACPSECEVDPGLDAMIDAAVIRLHATSVSNTLDKPSDTWTTLLHNSFRQTDDSVSSPTLPSRSSTPSSAARPDKSKLPISPTWKTINSIEGGSVANNPMVSSNSADDQLDELDSTTDEEIPLRKVKERKMRQKRKEVQDKGKEKVGRFLFSHVPPVRLQLSKQTLGVGLNRSPPNSAQTQCDKQLSPIITRGGWNIEPTPACSSENDFEIVKTIPARPTSADDHDHRSFVSDITAPDFWSSDEEVEKQIRSPSPSSTITVRSGERARWEEKPYGVRAYAGGLRGEQE